MLERWKRAWMAGKEAFRGGVDPQGTVRLNTAQAEALIQLLASYKLREAELEKHFPDIAFPVRLLGQSGEGWEWFPGGTDDASGEKVFEALIREDIGRYPANYTIITHDADVRLEEATIQVVAPGIRDTINKAALVKAKIALYAAKSADEVQQVLDDLSMI